MTTKEKVHALLTDADRGYISGEDLAGLCGVSRTAVWKAIDSLREEGCVLDAVTNRGYKIIAEPDKIDSDIILSSVKKFGAEPGAVFAFDTIDSTNTEAKRRAAEAGAFRLFNGALTKNGSALNRSLFVSGEQTAGRGRMGRPFYSPKNTGLYLSLVYSPTNGVKNPSLLTASAAVAVCRAVEYCYNVNCSIKWVNDVFAGGKKICGILTEGIMNFETGRIEAAIVGIGVNISDGGFPPEVASVAGSILGSKNISSSRESRNILAAYIMAELLKIYDNASDNTISFVSGSSASDSVPCSVSCGYAPSSVIDEYRRRSFLIGQTVSVNPVAGMDGIPYKCKVIDVDSEAGLVVETASGEHKTLHSGEVSLRSDNFVNVKK